MTKDNETPNFAEQAAQFIMSDEFNGKGPCLIPKPGREVPSCHENDFCECDMNKAFLAGCEHGYWVGKDEIDAAIDMSTQHTLDVMEERDHLKQQLADLQERYERSKGQHLTELDILRTRIEDAESTMGFIRGTMRRMGYDDKPPGPLGDFCQSIDAYFTKHPQDGAKEDL